MLNKSLLNLGLDERLNNSRASTSSGQSLLGRYKTACVNGQVGFWLVNQFLKEARDLMYDPGIREVSESLSDYISQNKTSWALGTVCENIRQSQSSFNKLNLIAAQRAEKLLEMDEGDVNRYLRAGALKDVMYCAPIRSVVRQVLGRQDIVESTTQYRRSTPVSFVEKSSNGFCWMVEGHLFELGSDGSLRELSENPGLSQLFFEMNSILRSAREGGVSISKDPEDPEKVLFETEVLGQGRFSVDENGRITRITSEGSQSFDINGFREWSDMRVRGVSQNRKALVGQALENLARLAENTGYIVLLDQCAVYETLRGSRFLVVENGSELLAESLDGNSGGRWKVQDSGLNVLEFLRSKTNTELGEVYEGCLRKSIEEADETHAREIRENLEQMTESGLRERISRLAEQYKNDPVRLAVLSRLGSQLAEL